MLARRRMELVTDAHCWAEMHADVAWMVLDVGAVRAGGWLLREMLASSCGLVCCWCAASG